MTTRLKSRKEISFAEYSDALAELDILIQTWLQQLTDGNDLTEADKEQILYYTELKATGCTDSTKSPLDCLIHLLSFIAERKRWKIAPLFAAIGVDILSDHDKKQIKLSEITKAEFETRQPAKKVKRSKPKGFGAVDNTQTALDALYAIDDSNTPPQDTSVKDPYLKECPAEDLYKVVEKRDTKNHTFYAISSNKYTIYYSFQTYTVYLSDKQVHLILDRPVQFDDKITLNDGTVLIAALDIRNEIVGSAKLFQEAIFSVLIKLSIVMTEFTAEDVISSEAYPPSVFRLIDLIYALEVLQPLYSMGCQYTEKINKLTLQVTPISSHFEEIITKGMRFYRDVDTNKFYTSLTSYNELYPKVNKETLKTRAKSLDQAGIISIQVPTKEGKRTIKLIPTAKVQKWCEKDGSKKKARNWYKLQNEIMKYHQWLKTNHLKERQAEAKEEHRQIFIEEYLGKLK